LLCTTNCQKRNEKIKRNALTNGATK